MVNNATNPNWCVLREAWFGRTFIGGIIDSRSLHQAINALRREGQVILNIGAKYSALFPQCPTEELPRLEFYGPVTGNSRFTTLLQAMPHGCEVCRVNERVISRCLWYNALTDVFGSDDRFLKESLGFCLKQSDEILSEAHAFFWGNGQVEIGTITREKYRGLGYATITCAHLIQACEERGYQTYWGCDMDNLASAAVARKLSYPYRGQYTLIVYKAQNH